MLQHSLAYWPIDGLSSAEWRKDAAGGPLAETRIGILSCFRCAVSGWSSPTVARGSMAKPLRDRNQPGCRWPPHLCRHGTEAQAGKPLKHELDAIREFDIPSLIRHVLLHHSSSPSLDPLNPSHPRLNPHSSLFSVYSPSFSFTISTWRHCDCGQWEPHSPTSSPRLESIASLKSLCLLFSGFTVATFAGPTKARFQLSFRFFLC